MKELTKLQTRNEFATVSNREDDDDELGPGEM